MHSQPSPIRFRRDARRPGVSIIEVLFAIGVTTIGLLGAIAVFPVASAQARKGRVADAVAVAGTSAVHDFDVRDMRRPATWVAYNAAGVKVSPYTQYTTYLQAEAATPGSGDPAMNWFGGTKAFCLDPRYFTANETDNKLGASVFPAFNADVSRPMSRISILGGTTTGINRAVAEAIFTLEDDLTYERPGDRSVNAVQLMDTAGVTGGQVYKRQTDGHLSWMATIVPKLDRSGIAFKDMYVLSIVMFYDRPLDLLLPTDTASSAEHLVTVSAFPGGGITGGEVQLSGSHDVLNKIAVHGWILLGSKMSNASGVQVPVFRWYRVVDAEDISEDSTITTRFVTLFGQDWDPLLTTGAVVVDGVTGVYEKTIRLDMTP